MRAAAQWLVSQPKLFQGSPSELTLLVKWVTASVRYAVSLVALYSQLAAKDRSSL
jgi:hypothetical protein